MDEFEVTFLTKMKHADLYRAAKKLGSQAALARHLGVRQTELGEWINLKTCPPVRPLPDTKWTKDYLEDLESKLLPLTGKTWEDLFPPEVRENYQFLECPKTQERTMRVERAALAQIAAQTTERLQLEAPGEEPRSEAVSALTKEILSMLTKRQREVLELRYGLNGDPPYTYAEIGRILRLTRERIRQIELRAIRVAQGIIERLSRPDDE